MQRSGGGAFVDEINVNFRHPLIPNDGLALTSSATQVIQTEAVDRTMFSRGRKPILRFGCLVALVLFSTYAALVTYPFSAWKFGAALGGLAFVSIFLRVGWFVPFTISGTYAGMILDAGVKGGTIESQMQETVTSIVAGAIFGFVVGALIDSGMYGQRQTIQAHEQSGEREPPMTRVVTS